MESTFQLFKLPHVALAEVLNLLEVEKQIFFAFCSKRAESVFTSLRNKRLTPKIVVSDDDWIGHSIINEQSMIIKSLICFSREPIPSFGKVEKVKMGKHLVTLHIWKRDFHQNKIHCKDNVNGMKILSDLIFNLYGVTIHILYISTSPHQLIDLVKGISIEILAIFGYKIEADQLSYILSNTKPKHLFIHYWPSNFKLNDRHHTKFDLLVVTDNMAIEHLMGFDCIEIILTNQSYSNKELNQFLIHWINGGNARLKCFVADIKDYNQQFALENIKVQKSEEQARNYKSLSTELQFENHLEIQRNDGVIASINYSQENKSFSLAVWPDNPDTPNRSYYLKTVSSFIKFRH